MSRPVLTTETGPLYRHHVTPDTPAWGSDHADAVTRYQSTDGAEYRLMGIRRAEVTIPTPAGCPECGADAREWDARIALRAMILRWQEAVRHHRTHARPWPGYKPGAEWDAQFAPEWDAWADQFRDTVRDGESQEFGCAHLGRRPYDSSGLGGVHLGPHGHPAHVDCGTYCAHRGDEWIDMARKVYRDLWAGCAGPGIPAWERR